MLLVVCMGPCQKSYHMNQSIYFPLNVLDWSTIIWCVLLWQTRDPQSHRYQNPRGSQRSKGIPSGKNTRHFLQPPIHLFPRSIAVCRKLVSSICEDLLGGWSWDSPNLLPSAPQKVTGAPRSGHGHWESHQVQNLTHWLGKSFRPFAFAARNGCAHTTKKMLRAFHGKRPRSGQTKSVKWMWSGLLELRAECWLREKPLKHVLGRPNGSRTGIPPSW